MAADKLLFQVCARLGEATIDELDAYVRERSATAGVPLSRSLCVRQIMEAWAAERRDQRAPKVSSARR